MRCLQEKKIQCVIGYNVLMRPMIKKKQKKKLKHKMCNVYNLNAKIHVAHARTLNGTKTWFLILLVESA